MMQFIDYQKELNPQQYEVVVSGEGPCLVLAGAGSGKTRTLVYRVAYLLERGVEPQNILLVTFTNRAAHQMRDRVEMLLGAKQKNVWWGTFHHIANRALRVYGKYIGIGSDFGILDEEDSAVLLKTVIRGLGIEAKDRLFPRPKVLQAVISYARNSKESISNILESKFADFTGFTQEINNIYGRYTAKKRESNNLDYDDLLCEWLRLLRQSPGAGARQSGFFKYILVDEYQDTNRLQFEIVKILSQAHKNILVVGDDAQSIYSFRAANLNNILDFPQEFPGAKIFKLETNYRSTPQILALANESISNNQRQYKKYLRTSLSDGELPSIVKSPDLNSQAAFIAGRVSELYHEGRPLDSIAVLFRAHYQSVELEVELIKRKIPYVLRGGIKFFEQAHIKDIISFLKIAHNPLDEIAWARALALQDGIGPSYADRIFGQFADEAKKINNLFSDKYWVFLPKRPLGGFNVFRRTMKRVLSDEVFGRPHLMLEAVFEDGYRNYCLSNFENSSDRIDDLKELLNFAHTYDSLERFLADVCLGETFKGETVLQPAGQPSEQLVLSTIHQAKGLEWDVVFLIGLIDNQFPHPKSRNEPAQFEEERRLFYVAATRAKRRLYLMHSMTRYDYNYGIVIARPSQFLAELNEDCYQQWRLDEADIPQEAVDYDYN